MTNIVTNLRRALLVSIALLAPSAFAQSGKLRVADVFEVGKGVFVRALTVESARNALWVGTSTGVHEVELHTLKAKNTFTRKDGLANEYVFAIGIDATGNKWFGTNAGGTSRYRNGQWKTFFPMHGLADYWVYAFANQADGTLWIGTWAGASHFDPRTGKFKNYVKELVNEWVYGIAVGPDKRVWFGTEGGVSMFDGKTWRAWTHVDGLGAANAGGLPPSTNTGLGTRSRHDLSTLRDRSETYNPNYVFSVLVARDKRVWAGTWGGGASRYDGQRWTNFTTQDGLGGNLVYAIAEDAAGALWFGTNRGVSRFDGKSWQRIGKEDGLLDHHVYALAITKSGDVWAGTSGGVTRIRVEK